MNSDLSRLYGTYPEELVIGPSLAVTVTPLPGQNSGVLKLSSGGTLWLIGTADTTVGCSFSVASRYMIAASEILNIDLTGNIVLGTTGATCRVWLLRGRSSGFTT